MQDRPLRWLAAAALACALAGASATAAAQDGSLRERLRERRTQGQPPAVSSSATGEAPARITAPGDYTFTLAHGGLTRRYLVHVPRSYQAATPSAVLVALHGGGGDMHLQADEGHYGLIGKSESAGYIAVFPNGYSALPGGRLATWNAGSCCGAARDKDIDDVGFLRQVVADLRRRLNVDGQRVYATGMSNGAMMAHRLACEAADVFSGIAAVAGTDGTRRCTPSRALPVLVIHARNDEHVLFDGGAGPGAFRDASKVADFTSVPETVARWVRRNACATAPVRVLQRPGAVCERYTGCRDGVAVQLCVTDAGGHSWPGAAQVRRGKEAASQALSANDVMWDFFELR